MELREAKGQGIWTWDSNSAAILESVKPLNKNSRKDY